MEPLRADPDRLLEQINQEEKNRKRGQLKIFFGYVAGVGKTYAMLRAAHRMIDQGVDVVVGYIEPHTRPETMRLLQGLPQIPAKRYVYNGLQLNEFDIDAVLERNPSLVLVDELAHTNAPSCRHRKRYQDIEELLDAGINVYTTMNVQHIESLNDIVAGITGVIVRERVPDLFFDNAPQVMLVDLEPKELIERLHEGKIYRERQASTALNHFFTLENLVALRELALRRAADRVNLLSVPARSPDAETVGADEHILVCLSSSPSNAHIIRNASRLVKAYKGLFSALYVQPTEWARLSDTDRKCLHDNMLLAEQLGAHVETVYGDDVAYQIAEYAKHSGITKIVLGRRNTARHLGHFKPSFSEELSALTEHIDIYIIPDKKQPDRLKRRFVFPAIHLDFRLIDTVKSLAILAATTLCGVAFASWGLSDSNIITVYILAVLLIAVTTSSRLHSVLGSIISVLAFNFFFTDPKFTLNAYASDYPVTFIIMFAAAMISGNLALRIKRQAHQSAQNSRRVSVLLETNRLLQKQHDRDEMIKTFLLQLNKLLGRTSTFYLGKGDELESPRLLMAAGDLVPREEYMSASEGGVANWAYKNNKIAGSGTNTLGQARCLYLPIKSNTTVWGIVGIGLAGETLEKDDENLLQSLIAECAAFLEKDHLIRRREESALQAKNEQLRANLLRSISHDFRIPLTGISGNASMLLSSRQHLDEDKKRELCESIYDDSIYLINLVENLLYVTRLEADGMQLRMEPELLSEVLTEALRHVNLRGSTHPIRIHQDDELLLAKMDFQLIIQVFLNLIDNAVKYTPDGTPIDITIVREGRWQRIDVADFGPGIPEESKSKIFDLFYTTENKSSDSRRGIGLGLALCKSIITAHGGTICIMDNKPRGSVFRFTLQACDVDLPEGEVYGKGDGAMPQCPGEVKRLPSSEGKTGGAGHG